MASEADNAEALEAAGKDADSMGPDAPDGVMKCRQLDTEHELEEPRLLEIQTEIEPPEDAAGAGEAVGSETGSGTGGGDTPESGAGTGATPESDA